jgi:hypothetical protein
VPWGTGLGASVIVTTRSARAKCVSQALRPWVAARKVRVAGSSFRLRTWVRGKPLTRVDQVVPTLVVAKMPMSVPTYRVLGSLGSITMSFAAMSGRLLLMLVQVAPPLVDL